MAIEVSIFGGSAGLKIHEEAHRSSSAGVKALEAIEITGLARQSESNDLGLKLDGKFVEGRHGQYGCVFDLW